ncbi:MAG: peroxiredoxin family protein [Blastocatellia bacterium]|nr:peroxiredoxin family protein [Blastocatellia bacterium]
MLKDTPNAQVEILAVSVDPHDKAQNMRDKLADKAGQDFPLLSDPDHRVIDRYGLLNEKSKRPVPHPATYVIDRHGKVRWKFIEVDYKVRPSNDDVLKEVLKVEKAK